jgi:hypothetical protein
MGFQPGNKLSKGRPKGALNRSTEEMKLSIARATNRALNNLPAVMDKLIKEDPKAAMELAIKLLEFNLPKLSRTEMKAEIEQKIQQISVNIQDGIANKHIKDV